MSDKKTVLSLKGAIERHCIEKLAEPVPLNSGGLGYYYCNLKAVSLRGDYAWKIGNLMAPLVEASGAKAVGGLAIGAMPISHAISQAAYQRGVIIPNFTVEKFRATPDSPIEMKLWLAWNLNLEDLEVAVVDDVITQGGAVQTAIDEVTKRGAKVVSVACVIERHEGGGERFREKGIPFKRLFYTDSEGNLYVDEELRARVGL